MNMSNRHLHCFIGISILLLGGCQTWTYRAVPNVNVSRPNELGSEGPLQLKIEPPGPAMTQAERKWIRDHEIGVASMQTVLVANWEHNVLGTYQSDCGRTLVVLLDGPPKPGRVWLNSENSMLINYSSYSAPSRQRIGVEGSIEILSVRDKEIDTLVAVRDTTEIDSSNFMDRPWDTLNRQFPFKLTGKHTFAITTPSDPLFKSAGVKWEGQ
jgi:hypothetical protein